MRRPRYGESVVDGVVYPKSGVHKILHNAGMVWWLRRMRVKFMDVPYDKSTRNNNSNLTDDEIRRLIIRDRIRQQKRDPVPAKNQKAEIPPKPPPPPPQATTSLSSPAPPTTDLPIRSRPVLRCPSRKQLSKIFSLVGSVAAFTSVQQIRFHRRLIINTRKSVICGSCCIISLAEKCLNPKLRSLYDRSCHAVDTGCESPVDLNSHCNPTHTPSSSERRTPTEANCFVNISSELQVITEAEIGDKTVDSHHSLSTSGRGTPTEASCSVNTDKETTNRVAIPNTDICDKVVSDINLPCHNVNHTPSTSGRGTPTEASVDDTHDGPTTTERGTPAEASGVDDTHDGPITTERGTPAEASGVDDTHDGPIATERGTPAEASGVDDTHDGPIATERGTPAEASGVDDTHDGPIATERGTPAEASGVDDTHDGPITTERGTPAEVSCSDNQLVTHISVRNIPGDDEDQDQSSVNKTTQINSLNDQTHDEDIPDGLVEGNQSSDRIDLEETSNSNEPLAQGKQSFNKEANSNSEVAEHTNQELNTYPTIDCDPNENQIEEKRITRQSVDEVTDHQIVIEKSISNNDLTSEVYIEQSSEKCLQENNSKSDTQIPIASTDNSLPDQSINWESRKLTPEEGTLISGHQQLTTFIKSEDGNITHEDQIISNKVIEINEEVPIQNDNNSTSSDGLRKQSSPECELEKEDTLISNQNRHLSNDNIERVVTSLSNPVLDPITQKGQECSNSTQEECKPDTTRECDDNTSSHPLKPERGSEKDIDSVHGAIDKEISSHKSDIVVDSVITSPLKETLEVEQSMQDDDNLVSDDKKSTESDVSLLKENIISDTIDVDKSIPEDVVPEATSPSILQSDAECVIDRSIDVSSISEMNENKLIEEQRPADENTTSHREEGPIAENVTSDDQNQDDEIKQTSECLSNSQLDKQHSSESELTDSSVVSTFTTSSEEEECEDDDSSSGVLSVTNRKGGQDKISDSTLLLGIESPSHSKGIPLNETIADKSECSDFGGQEAIDALVSVSRNQPDSDTDTDFNDF